MKHSTTERQLYVCVQSEVCNIPEKKVRPQQIPAQTLVLSKISH